jgi:uncharacterized protein
MPIADPWFYLFAIPAVVLMGLGKAGFAGALALLSMPLMAMSVPPLQAAGIMLPILLVMDVISVWAWRKAWSRENLKIIVPAGLAGIALGYLTATMVTDAGIRLMVGCLGLLFCLNTWLRREEGGSAPTSPSLWRGSLWASIAGFTSFISHVGGPPLAIYLLPQRLAKEVFTGTTVIFFTIINFAKAGPFLALGLLSPVNVATSAALLPVAILSTLAGVWLVKRISGQLFYSITYAMLFVVSLKLLYDGLVAMAA